MTSFTSPCHPPPHGKEQCRTAGYFSNLICLHLFNTIFGAYKQDSLIIFSVNKISIELTKNETYKVVGCHYGPLCWDKGKLYLIWKRQIKLYFQSLLANFRSWPYYWNSHSLKIMSTDLVFFQNRVVRQTVLLKSFLDEF